MPSAEHRRSNIESLRIIAMLMIVAHHFSLHGGFVFQPADISVNCLWIQFLQLGGKISVDIFVLISGYFLITTTSFKVSKVIKLWLQMLTYSVAIYAGAVLLGYTGFSKDAFLSTLFPVSMYSWWFATAYFKLFLLSPVLNILLKAMSRRTYRIVLSIMLLLWCVMPTISAVYPGFTVAPPLKSDLTWFITLYCLAAYIRLWHVPFRHKAKSYLLISFIAFALTYVSALIYDHLNFLQLRMAYYPTVLYEMTSPTILIAAVFALIGFLQLDLPYNRWINLIASASFGVYLLHDHDATRPFLWHIIFKNASFADSSYLIPYSLGVILLVYSVCTVIELIRIHLLEQNYMPLIRKATAGLDNLLEKLFAALSPHH